MTARFTLFADAYSKTPAAQDDLTWGEVCDEIEALTEREAEDKRYLPAFHFGALTDNARGKDNTGSPEAPCNLNANVTEVTSLVIDVDTCDADVVWENVEALDANAIMYASPSDPNPDGSRRVRVCVELDAPLAPSEIKHARKALAEAIGLGPGCGIEFADAPSQIMFLGRIAGTPARQVWRRDGKPMASAELACASLAQAWRPSAPEAAKALDGFAAADPDERTAALVEALERHWEPPGAAEGRRQVLRGLGGYLARRGWDDGQIAAACMGLPTARPEAERVALAVEAARAARKDPDGTAGWASLAAWSPAAAQAIERTAKDPAEPRDWPGVWSDWWRGYHARHGIGPAARASKFRVAGPEIIDDFDWDAPEVPIEWYCRGLMIAPSERKITLIAGDPGAGKGPLANYLAVCFAFGLQAFGEHECRVCNVGILDFEGARLTARRVRSQARGLGVDPRDVKGRVFLRDCDPGLDVPWIAAWIEERGIEVLIVDSYMSASSASGVDPNSPEFADFARELGTLGIVVIIIAHARKPASGKNGERPALGDVAGSFALGALAATAISVWNPDLDNRNLQRIGCMRAPEGVFPTFDLEWSQSGTDAEPVWSASMIGVATRAAIEQDAAAVKAHAADVADTDAVRKVIDFFVRFPERAALSKITKNVKLGTTPAKNAVLTLVEAGAMLEDLSGGQTLYMLREGVIAQHVSVVSGRVEISEAVAGAAKFRRPAPKA